MSDELDFILPDLTVLGTPTDYGTDAGGTLPGTGAGGAGTSYTGVKNPDGTVSIVDSTGTPVDTSNTTAAGGFDLSKLGTAGGIGTLGALIAAAMGANKPGTTPGWHGVIDPNLEAQRQQIPQPAYEPYSDKPVMGSNQFTDLAVNPKGTAYAPTVNGVPLADYLAKKGIGSLPKDFGPKENDQAGPLRPEESVGRGYDDGLSYLGGSKDFDESGQPMAHPMAAGGVASLAHGGRYLNGPTDGMADKLDTTIDGTQAAKLSHGEFVIPADVVSHLGNGNSTAGADVLYRMMDRVRKARTGNPKQGKQINPEKFMPGGLASLSAYANGGVIGFDGTTGSAVTSAASGTQGTASSVPVTTESNLSSWAGPGVADYIQRGTALAKAPQQVYTGPLTAGASPLQQQSFKAASNLTTPTSLTTAGTTAADIGNKMGAMSYSPVGSTMDADTAKQYMNPYLQASLDPQLAEARRQSQITQMGNDTRATQAGAFGGSRGALMNAEAQRNLGTNLAGITGAGYNTAYDKATSQFNADQTRKAQEAQFGSNFGMNALTQQLGANNAAANIGSMQNAVGIANLGALSSAGATQQGIEAQNVAARKAEFETQRKNPFDMVTFEQGLYQSLPVSTATSSTATTPAQQFGQAVNQATTTGTQVNNLVDKLVGP